MTTIIMNKDTQKFWDFINKNEKCMCCLLKHMGNETYFRVSLQTILDVFNGNELKVDPFKVNPIPIHEKLYYLFGLGTPIQK